MQYSHRTLLIAVAIVFGGLSATRAQTEPNPILEVELESSVDRGLPVYWSDRNAILLRDNGAIRQLNPQQLRSHRLLDEPFRPQTLKQAEMDLLKEFPRGFSTATAEPYVVIAPTGSEKKWVAKFRDIYNGFRQYFGTRGIALRQPAFPLIAIVFPSEKELLAYAQSTGTPLSPGTLGYYSLATNRMIVYDIPKDSAPGMSGYNTESTLIHEAAHQAAYNLGLHDRLAITPLWVVEGLATMFEAPGIYDSRTYRMAEHKLNMPRFSSFRDRIRSGAALAEAMEKLVRGDGKFDSDPDIAYAVAWGVSLYLAERDSARYISYLQKMAQRPINVSYPETQRDSDFRSHFTADYAILANQIYRYINSK